MDNVTTDQLTVTDVQLSPSRSNPSLCLIVEIVLSLAFGLHDITFSIMDALYIVCIGHVLCWRVLRYTIHDISTRGYPLPKFSSSSTLSRATIFGNTVSIVEGGFLGRSPAEASGGQQRSVVSNND